MTPATASNPLSTSHIVTATVKKGDGTPISGRTVTFSVDSGPDAGQTGTDATDANGQATFTVTNNGTAATGHGLDQFRQLSRRYAVGDCDEDMDEATGGSPHRFPRRGEPKCHQHRPGPVRHRPGFTRLHRRRWLGWPLLDHRLRPTPEAAGGHLRQGRPHRGCPDQVVRQRQGRGPARAVQRGARKKGLGLIVITNGNTDRLQLVTMDQFGKRTVLSPWHSAAPFNSACGIG